MFKSAMSSVLISTFFKSNNEYIFYLKWNSWRTSKYLQDENKVKFLMIASVSPALIQ